MEHDVFDDDDGVVDDEADGCGEAAEGHQVEAGAEGVEEEEGDRDGDRDDQPRDDGRAPVAQEDHDDDGGEDDADEDGVADRGDGFADEFGLVVEGLERDAGREVFLQLHDFGGDLIGDGDGVGGGLAGDVEEDGGLAVGLDAGVDGLDGLLDVGDVGDVDGDAFGRVLDDDGAEGVGVVRLRADQREDELRAVAVEAG